MITSLAARPTRLAASPSPRVVAACSCRAAASPVVVGGGVGEHDVTEDRWSYTVGRSGHGLPELVLLGLEPTIARGVLRLVHEAWHGLRLGVPFDLCAGRFVLHAVPQAWLAHDPRRMAQWWPAAANAPISPSEVLPDLVQVVWGDAGGRFPDDPRCDPMVAEGQPVLAADPFSVPRRSSVGAPVRRRSPRRPWPSVRDGLARTA